METLRTTAELLKTRLPELPTVGIILGSGFHHLMEGLAPQKRFQKRKRNCFPPRVTAKSWKWQCATVRMPCILT